MFMLGLNLLGESIGKADSWTSVPIDTIHLGSEVDLRANMYPCSPFAHILGPATALHEPKAQCQAQYHTSLLKAGPPGGHHDHQYR